jgi:hypothetical protein
VDPDLRRLFEEFKTFNDAIVSRVEGGMRAVIRSLDAQAAAFERQAEAFDRQAKAFDAQARALGAQTRSMERNTRDISDELKAQRDSLFLILDEIRGAQGGA